MDTATIILCIGTALIAIIGIVFFFGIRQKNNKTVYDVIDTVLEGFSPNVLDESEVQYHCDCNRQRVEKALISIGIKDLEMLRDEEDQIEMGCQYCDAKYYFTKKDLDRMIKELKNK